MSMSPAKTVVLVLLEPAWEESGYASKSMPLIEKHIDANLFEINTIGSYAGIRILKRVSDNVYPITFSPKAPHGLRLFLGYLLYLVSAFFKTVRIAPRIGAQVLISLGGHAYTGFITTLAGKLLRKKTIVRISEPTRHIVRSRYKFGPLVSLFVNIVERVTFSFSDVLVSNRDMSWYSPKITAKQRLISQGINLSLFNPKVTRAFDSREFPKLITVARLDKQKNIGAVIEAVRLLKYEYPKILYYIVGSGPDERYLRERVAKLGVNKQVCFYGYVSPEKVPGVLSSCDIFVLPSMIEGLPSAALEAMACGLPVVMGWTWFGWKEWFTDAENALLVKGYPRDIAEAIDRLASNAELRKKLSTNGIKYVEKHHDSSKTRSQFTATVRQLLKNPERRGT